MTHLCLVSEQPVPNILPVLDSDPTIKPERVILAVSDKMRTKADFLQAALAARQIPCERLELPSAFDLNALQRFFIEWLDKREDEEIALNVTGGTKPMAIAAQEAFRMADKPVFYVSVESDELLWIGVERAAHQLTKPLSLKTYLAIHGYTMERTKQKVPETWITLGTEMVRNAPKWAKALGALNYYASDATARDVLDVGRLTTGAPHWDEMMEQLWGNEIIRDRERLHFRSPEARFFANGGWLEWHIFNCVKQIEGVHEPHSNLQICYQGANRNELDVAFLKRNRLFIIECKTKRFHGEADEYHGPAAEAIYKLDYLRRTGGLRTKCILVSFMPIGETHKKRAADAGITIIDQSCLPRLEELLKGAMR